MFTVYLLRCADCCWNIFYVLHIISYVHDHNGVCGYHVYYNWYAAGGAGGAVLARSFHWICIMYYTKYYMIYTCMYYIPGSTSTACTILRTYVTAAAAAAYSRELVTRYQVCYCCVYRSLDRWPHSSTGAAVLQLHIELLLYRRVCGACMHIHVYNTRIYTTTSDPCILVYVPTQHRCCYCNAVQTVSTALVVVWYMQDEGCRLPTSTTAELRERLTLFIYIRVTENTTAHCWWCCSCSESVRRVSAFYTYVCTYM